MRIGLESLIITKIGDKIRQHIRMKSQTNDVNIRFTSKLKTEDVFYIINELFSEAETI